MKKILLFSSLLLLLTACNSAPILSLSEGERMAEEFFQLMKNDPQAAYLQTDDLLQANTTPEEFAALKDNWYVQNLSDISMSSVALDSAAYSSDYDGPYALTTLSGTASFTDSTSTPLTVLWFYDFEVEAWELDGFQFEPSN